MTTPKKSILDNILKVNKAQPVGWGYIDIIVSRNYYKQLIEDLILSGFKINSISWWEWCPKDTEPHYGLGGPSSKYYEGRFSELPIGEDDFENFLGKEKSNIINELITFIELKSIDYPNEKVHFNEVSWLTPAIWLDVPDDWRNTIDSELNV